MWGWQLSVSELEKQVQKLFFPLFIYTGSQTPVQRCFVGVMLFENAQVRLHYYGKQIRKDRRNLTHLGVKKGYVWSSGNRGGEQQGDSRDASRRATKAVSPPCFSLCGLESHASVSHGYLVKMSVFSPQPDKRARITGRWNLDICIID